MISRREFLASALAIMPMLSCQGCIEVADLPLSNIFDEMLRCNVAAFAGALGADYVGEKFKLDDGFRMLRDEASVRVQYGLFRYFEDGFEPTKLVFSKRVFIPASEGNALSVKFREVYLGQASVLKTGDAYYWKLNSESVYDSRHPEDNNYVSISPQDAQLEIGQIGAVELLEHIKAGISERFVSLFLRNMESSFDSHDWGSFHDERE